jgi:hypothetical protein
LGCNGKSRLELSGGVALLQVNVTKFYLVLKVIKIIIIKVIMTV